MDLNLLSSALRGVTQVATPANAHGAAGATRVALSLQALLPVIEASGASPATTQFAQDLRGLLADAVRGLSTVFVVQPAGSGQMRIEVGRQFLNVPPTLRDAVLALIQSRAQAPSSAAGGAEATLTTTATTPPPMTAASAVATVAPGLTLNNLASAQVLMAQMQASAQGLVAASGAFGARRSVGAGAGAQALRATAATIHANTVLLDVSFPRADGAACRLRSVVENSGLFFESHLAQWSAGERSAQEVRAELTQVQRNALAALAHDDSPVRHSAAASGERVAAQLDVLQKSSFVVQAQAWAGQSCTVQFREEVTPDGHALGGGAPGQAPVIVATLVLDLPHFGPLEVELKLAGTSVAVQASAQPQSKAAVAGALTELGHALQARGLTPVALTHGALTPLALAAP